MATADVPGVALAARIAVGPDGSVYITGGTEVTGQLDDLLLRKYQ